MPDKTYSEAHSATSAAIVKLGYLTEDELLLRVFVDTILSIAVNGGRFVHNRQKAASRKQVEKEILEVRRTAERLSNILNDLHGTTFEKFAEAGLDISAIDSNCSQIASGCKYLIDTSNVPIRLPKSKTRASEQQITQELAGLFTRATGRPASITNDPYSQTTSGDFLELVQAVFHALGIEASASSCVDHVRRHRSI